MPTGDKAKNQTRGKDGRFAKSAASGGPMPVTVKVTSSGAKTPLAGLVESKLKQGNKQFTQNKPGGVKRVTPVGGIRG